MPKPQNSSTATMASRTRERRSRPNPSAIIRGVCQCGPDQAAQAAGRAFSRMRTPIVDQASGLDEQREQHRNRERVHARDRVQRDQATTGQRAGRDGHADRGAVGTHDPARWGHRDRSRGPCRRTRPRAVHCRARGRRPAARTPRRTRRTSRRPRTDRSRRSRPDRRCHEHPAPADRVGQPAGGQLEREHHEPCSGRGQPELAERQPAAAAAAARRPGRAGRAAPTAAR